MSDWLSLLGKTIIVTGGSSGIGEAIVKELLQNGANVVNGDLKRRIYTGATLNIRKDRRD